MSYLSRVVSLFGFVLACLISPALFYAGCSNGDEFLYDENDSLFIDVSAELTYSFDSSSARLKSDTLRPGDSVIFIANILPSKSIKIRRYLWTLDGEPFSFDFSFRRNVETPGTHTVAFILETYLGDTLTDTLTLQVSTPPVLDKQHFIPAANSQGLSPEGGISFAWNAYDPDSIADLSFHFVIDGFIDTVITQNGFTYWGNLPPLSQFNWSVQAINEFGIPSEQIIRSKFFTRGGPHETGFTGYLGTSARANYPHEYPLNYTISLLDTTGKEVWKSIIQANSIDLQAFSIKPLEKGHYRAAFSIPEYPDFTSDTVGIVLNEGSVLSMDTLLLLDNVPPEISGIVAGTVLDDIDTLQYADTLRFLVKDKGSPLSNKSVSAYLESTPLTEATLSDDTLTIIIPATMRSWNTRLIDIVATDASKNKSKRNFVLLNGESWIQTNKSQTCFPGDSIRIYIIDNNKFGFTPKTCTFEIGNKVITIPSNDLLCSTELKIDDIPYGDNEVKCTMLYSNGIRQSSRWVLTKATSAGGSP